MKKNNYKQILSDWEYLWDIGEPEDMTGGYEDQYDLEKMLKNPTKNQAKECMLNQIEYWFQVGPDLKKKPDLNDKLNIIMNRYGIETFYK